jgi:ABC-type glutathione transport system ATPase component
MPERVLEAHGLRRTFAGRGRDEPYVAVDDLSFTLDDGGALAIVGGSGAGKTTAIRIVAGLLAPTAGRVTVAGRVRAPGPARAAERRRRARETQLVFQDPYASLDPLRTIDQELGAVIDLHLRPSRAERARRIAELLHRVGLGARHGRLRPRALSGGERQRVAIARALAAEPRVLLLDEPVAALDVSIQAQILNLLVEVRRATGIAQLLVSHDLAVVRHISDDIIVMDAGRVVERGRVAAVFEQPRHAYTQLLLRSMPRPGWTPERSARTSEHDDAVA